MNSFLKHCLESEILEKVSKKDYNFDIPMSGDTSRKIAYRQLLRSCDNEIIIVATDIKSQCLDSLDMLQYFESFLQKSGTKVELILQAQNKYDIALANCSLRERLGYTKNQVYSTFVAPKVLKNRVNRSFQWLNDIPPFAIGDEKAVLSLQDEDSYRHLLFSQEDFNINFNNPEKAKKYKQQLTDAITKENLIATNSEYFIDVLK